MQTVQRMLLVLLASVCLVTGITVVFEKKWEKRYSQWENLKTEQFLQQICRTGSVSLAEYTDYGIGLSLMGAGFEIQIEEYQREQDLDGKSYYYLVTWEEVKSRLQEDGRYVFQRESVLKLVVNRERFGKTGKSEYYIIISREEKRYDS